MTQALAGFNEHGIVLATDSRASRFDAEGRAEYFSIKKLLPLGAQAAILSGGAGVSVALSRALQREIGARRGLDHLEDMADFALGFLSEGYERHLARHGPEPEGFRRLYFILAGYSPDQPPPGFSLLLLGSEENELPLRLIPTTNLVVMPRNLGMEMRLFKALNQGASLQELLRLSRDFLEKMAAAKEEVGSPFHFATITAAGYREVKP
ncbi:MAG: hypothetical protein NTY36_17140 [Deltaproteobacteria bacterium]|nr:hypothetical protein [Deltaproteobacteria bacterium]